MSFLFSRNFFLSLLTSLLLGLSFPGSGGLWPIVFIALIPLFYVIRRGVLKTSFLAGLTSGMLFYMILLYWIIIVLGKYGGLPWIVSSQGLVLLSLYMSFYLIAFSAVAHLFFRGVPDYLSLWLLPALWVGLDWFRGMFLTGLPWMDLGYSLYEVPLLIQIADIGGHHAVSFCIVLINTYFFFLIDQKLSLRRFLSLSPAVAAVVLVILYSGNRYAEIQSYEKSAAAQKITLGVVQGNIRQDQKWSPELQEKTVNDYVELSRTLYGENVPGFVVWPETALPFYPQSSDHMAPLYNFTKELATEVLSGAPWYEIVDRKARKIKFFNSAVFFTADGAYKEQYFKTHLVPFGEYVPFKKYLPFISPLVEAVGDFTPGVIEEPLESGKVKAGVLICFESVFPDLSRRWVNAGANIIINLTNDAWYGRSSAPVQSLAMSVLRAVETRRSVVRSANTGISAFIAPTGKVVKKSEIFVTWAEKSEVTLSSGITFWSRYGYKFAPICFALSVFAFVLASFMQKRAELD